MRPARLSFIQEGLNSFRWAGAAASVRPDTCVPIRTNRDPPAAWKSQRRLAHALEAQHSAPARKEIVGTGWTHSDEAVGIEGAGGVEVAHFRPKGEARKRSLEIQAPAELKRPIVPVPALKPEMGQAPANAAKRRYLAGVKQLHSN